MFKMDAILWYILNQHTRLYTRDEAHLYLISSMESGIYIEKLYIINKKNIR